MNHFRLIAPTAGLFALLALTYASSFVGLGIGNFLISTTIAIAKAALVATFFMRLGRKPMSRAVISTGLAFLLILYWLTGNDIWTRPEQPTPSYRTTNGR